MACVSRAATCGEDRKPIYQCNYCGHKKSSLVAAFLFGAGNETRTRDPDLGKVVLYQLSYSRILASPRGFEPLLPP
jgi:hypothetical protein